MNIDSRIKGYKKKFFLLVILQRSINNLYRCLSSGLSHGSSLACVNTLLNIKSSDNLHLVSWKVSIISVMKNVMSVGAFRNMCGNIYLVCIYI